MVSEHKSSASESRSIIQAVQRDRREQQADVSVPRCCVSLCSFLNHAELVLMRRLELYFSDKRNFLIVFRDKRQRQVFMSRLQSKNDPRDVISKSVIGNLVLDTVARAMDKSEQQLEAMTRRWQSREITNVSSSQDKETVQRLKI
jgi:hypothetical protein